MLELRGRPQLLVPGNGCGSDRWPVVQLGAQVYDGSAWLRIVLRRRLGTTWRDRLAETEAAGIDPHAGEVACRTLCLAAITQGRVGLLLAVVGGGVVCHQKIPPICS
jgi:hypothetical protein